MHSDQHKRMTELVSTAMELPSDKISAYLDKACGEDIVLRHEIEQLLNLNICPDFLEHSAVKLDSHACQAPQLTDQIGKIKLNQLIATGGMGEVYSGIDTILKRSVAVKVIKAGIHLSSKGKADFLNEAQILSSLNHPNICQVFDYFNEDDKDILVLELVDGQTLRESIKENQTIDALNIASQIADALVVAHERGIIHRDLKPENIMITPKGTVKILDFGLARLTESSDIHTPPEAPNQAANLTQIAGTPGYMSPEQSLGKHASTATDLWSLGILLCELLTGKLPHPENSSPDELITRTQAAQYNIPKNLPTAETKLLKQLLSPKAKNRPSARAALNEIKRIQQLPKERLKWVLGLGFITMALFSGWKYTTDLQHQTNKANTARLEAEKLASFMLHDLHPQLRALGKLGLLESAATKTLSYYDNLDPEQSRKTLDKQALALIKIASVFDDQGDIEKAMNTYKKAKTILVQLNTDQPEDEMILLRLGQVNMNIGELLTIVGDYDASKTELEAAITLSKRLIKGFPPEKASTDKPSTHDRWWLHLRSIYLISDTYRRKGELNTALSLLSEITPIAKTAANHLPSLLPNYADISYMKCNTLYQKSIDQHVVKACTEMADQSKQALKQNPDEFRLNLNHSIDLAFLASIYHQLNQPEKALVHVDKALAISQKLHQWDPENQTTENDLISNLHLKGQILFEQGKFSASEIIFNDTYQRILRLTETNEELHFVHNKLHAEIYLNKLNDAQKTADFLKAKGMKTRDLSALFDELTHRQKLANE